jgi:hypothetical protein
MSENKTEMLTPTRVTPSFKKRIDRAMCEMGINKYSHFISVALNNWLEEVEDEFQLEPYPKDNPPPLK